jgi:hypothetical protein
VLRLVLPLLLLLAPQLAFAKAAGVDSRKDMPPLGCGSAATGEQLQCHFQDANPQLVVSIANDDPAHPDVAVGPEGFASYTASIPIGSFEKLGAGINVHIDRPNPTGCELEPLAPVGKIDFKNDSLDPTDPVLSHRYDGKNPPPVTLVGVWSYQFLVLNCKAPGAFLLRVAMNAFDGSGDESGEVWNSSTLEVNAVPEPDAALVGAAAIAGLGALARRRRA